MFDLEKQEKFSKKRNDVSRNDFFCQGALVFVEQKVKMNKQIYQKRILQDVVTP